jgi:hypothetical protein
MYTAVTINTKYTKHTYVYNPPHSLVYSRGQLYKYFIFAAYKGAPILKIEVFGIYMACAQLLNVTCIYWYIRYRRSSHSSVIIHHPLVKASQMNKMADMIANYHKFEASVVVTLLPAEGLGRSKIHHRWVFMARIFSAERKCLCGATNLKTAEWHWMVSRET